MQRNFKENLKALKLVRNKVITVRDAHAFFFYAVRQVLNEKLFICSVKFRHKETNQILRYSYDIYY